MTRAEERSGVITGAWLWLLAEGGWHKLPEIRVGAQIDAKNFPTEVYRMVEVGYLVRRGEKGGRNRDTGYEYGVTATCRTPRGVTVGQINAALFGTPVVVQTEAEEA